MTTNLSRAALSVVAHYESFARSGRMPMEQAKQAALLAVTAMRYGNNDYFWVESLDGILLANDYNKNSIGKYVADEIDVPGGKLYFAEQISKARLHGSGLVHYRKPRPGKADPVEKIASVQLFEPWGWVIATGLYLDDVEETVLARGVVIALWSAGVVLPILALLSVVGLGISSPVIQITSVIGRLADGDVDITVPYRNRGDEIGAIAAAVQVFKDNLIHTRHLEEEKSVARVAAEVQRTVGMSLIADKFESTVGGIIGRLTGVATELQATAECMAGTAGETADQSLGATTAAEKAAVNVGIVAVAADQLRTSVLEIRRQVDTSAELAQTTVFEADRTGMLVNELSGAVSRIGNVAGLIASIARQTNLLALNATIEAARAREVGRSFAVVAGEVKELAGKTAEATDQIEDQVAHIEMSTSQAVSAISEIIKRIQHMNNVTKSIAVTVAEQGVAAQEIALNVSAAAAGTGEVVGSITRVAETAEATGTAARQVLEEASALSDQSDRLTIEVNRFLATVRAA
ncbi:methyl-accepting chemotaxis protein [Methylobacterium sp. J-077]|uniref:methyl-accepting chemotaxis protein n=1 Tax=Methylobacterium sp. J-077 TaxID=2836656 RepID=UPI001FBAFCCA|nr:cache domain-containing protein [Methylobacterium sp. J-077]MCJ2127247.1 cache domain-containing protein [Methylobacterium sp. J-077]